MELSSISQSLAPDEPKRRRWKTATASALPSKITIVAGLGEADPIEFRSLFGADFEKSAYEATR